MPSFTFGIKLEHGGGEQMRGGVAEHLDGVRIFRGEDRELHVVVERARKIDQFAIDAGDERVFREARPDLRGDLRGGGAAGHFACGAVRQRDLNGFHFLCNFSGSDECRLELVPCL